MQIVIEINDEIYETLKKCEVMASGLRGEKTFTSKIYTAVANGTPLPKGHGRLIDADALDLEKEVSMADDWKTAHEIANCVKYAPTIIEADKENDDEN